MKHVSTNVRWKCARDEGNASVLKALEAAIQQGPEAFESYLEEPHRGGWWGRLVTPEGAFFVKGRHPLGLRRRVASLLLPRGQESEWGQLLWFQAQGFQTATPFALGEYRWLGMLQLSVLVTHWVQNSRTLAQAMEMADREGRLELIDKTGTYLGALFCKGVLHRQPHARNLLLVGSGQTEEMIAIDLKHAWISSRFTDQDFLWWLDQVSFWLRPPTVDWSDPEQAGTLYQAVVGAAAPSLKNSECVYTYVDALLARGRTSVKLHRQEWQLEY